jgi:hypothetical protein
MSVGIPDGVRECKHEPAEKNEKLNFLNDIQKLFIRNR